MAFAKMNRRELFLAGLGGPLFQGLFCLMIPQALLKSATQAWKDYVSDTMVLNRSSDSLSTTLHFWSVTFDIQSGGRHPRFRAA
jgi:hypothetical protein